MYLTIIWLVAILLALILYFRQTYSRFNKYGIKHFRPIPPFGNIASILLKRDHFVDMVMRTYNNFPTERFVGHYDVIKPSLIIRDVELVKKITVKDFEYFLDHRVLIDEEADPFFGKNLFSLKGQKWKDMRSTLSPAFTSSKIRVMVPFMVEIGNQMILSLKNRLKESGEKYIEVDIKDIATRYANDVIASCAFGLKVDSHMDQNNDFYKMGKLTSNFTFKQLLVFFGYTSFPELMKFFKIRLFGESSTNFFKNLVTDTMRNREVHNIIRPDMIHLLMEAKKGKLTLEDKNAEDIDAGFATVEESSVGKREVLREWSDDDLIAQAVLFFIAGFETVSTAMSFLLYEVACNPEVQDKLVKEIRENETKNGGKFDYNSILSMKYLDMVVSETLRLWPPAIATDRICIKDYNMGKVNEKATEDFILRKGDGVQIPAWAFHRDPQFFPNPDKFDPERFSDENKHNIQPFAYMPFGLGPRNCIGSRFALCEVKVMAYQLLQHMEVSPGKKTSIPAKLSLESFNLRLEGGHFLNLKIRE